MGNLELVCDVMVQILGYGLLIGLAAIGMGTICMLIMVLVLGLWDGLRHLLRGRQ
jgi:hypothetical protein